MRKRHRYVTVIVNGDISRTLAMVPHRNSAALNWFFIAHRQRRCKSAQVSVAYVGPNGTTTSRPWPVSRSATVRYGTVLWRRTGRS